MTVKFSVLTKSRSFLHVLQLAVVCLIASSLVGCAEETNRVPVSGTVTVKGKPLALGRIIFDPVAGTEGVLAIGDVKDGSFTLFTDEEGDGVEVGKYYPTILDPKGDERKRKQRLGVVQLPEVEFEVTAEGPNEFEIEIKARDLEFAVDDD